MLAGGLREAPVVLVHNWGVLRPVTLGRGVVGFDGREMASRRDRASHAQRSAIPKPLGHVPIRVLDGADQGLE